MNNPSIKSKCKTVKGVLRHAESKSGIYFWLAQFLHRVLATFLNYLKTVFAGFC
mgnify:CR=1 FL=1